MIYGVLPLIALIILGLRYLALKEASRGSKVAVAAIVAAGLLVWWRYPQWLLVAILLQSAISIYLLVYLKLRAVCVQRTRRPRVHSGRSLCSPLNARPLGGTAFHREVRRGIMRAVSMSFVTVIYFLWSGPTWSAEKKETTPMQKDGMVMTVLEAQVSKPNWPKLAEAYSERTRKLPPGLVQTFLVQSRDENTVWRIISVWESQRALDEMRRTTETPGGVLMFRAAGAEPKLGVYDVNQQVRR